MNDNFILGFASPVWMKKVVNLHCGIYGNYYSLNLNTGGTRILLQLESSRHISFGPRDNQEDDSNNLPSWMPIK